MAQELIDKIRAAAQAKNVDPDVAVRIAQAESSLIPSAKAKTSTASGLFQVTAPTWKEFRGRPGMQLNPDENIRVGTEIIARNTDFLRTRLGRDPSASEIYAAHFFGPTGAASVLSASPDTPVADILGQRAVKANPQLQGKTVAEVREMLSSKMGEKPAPQQAAPAPAKGTPPEAMPDFEGVGRGQLTADLGSGYKAALALSFLGDEEDSDEKKLDDEEKQAAKMLAEYKPFNALAELEFTPSVNPLAAANPVQVAGQVPVQMAHGGEVQHLAAGGLPFVPTAMVRPSARAQLAGIKAQYDKYNADAEAYNKAADAYNAGPRTEEFTMAAPVAPTTSQEQYNTLAQNARTDAARRNMALQAAADPERFGLSINRFFADGGEVAEPSVAEKMLRSVVPMDLRILGSTLAGNREPITERNFNQEELAAMQQSVDRATARTGQAQKGSVQYVDYPKGQEIGPGFQPVGQTLGRFTYEKQPDGTTVIRDRYDFYNEGRKGNVEAYEKMGRGEKALTVSGRALKNLLTGDFRGIPNELADAYIGRQGGRDVQIRLPVRRADGGNAEPTPEELEAASRPATFNPKIARQGAAARQLAAQRDVNTLPDPRTYAAVSGFLGTPPDQQGFSVMHPDIEGIKRAADVGFTAGTALQIAPAAGAVRNLVGKGTTQASRALEGLKNIPVGASTKSVEPIFQHLPSAEAPFVGRLDEFVAGLPGSVQKDQFLGMLKGKFRDYDIARAQETLSDLPGNAKIAPVDLLNRIKTQYDPSQFKTTVLPPTAPGQYYHSIDNIYFNRDAPDQAPLGVIHLSQNLPPDVLQRQQAARDAGVAISRIATQGNYGTLSPNLPDLLVQAVKNPMLPLSEGTASKMLSVARDYRALAERDVQWEAAKDRLLYPILQPEYKAARERHLADLMQENPGVSQWDLTDAASRRSAKELAESANQWLTSNGFAPVRLPDYNTIENPLLHFGTNHDALRDVTKKFDAARENTLEALKDIKFRATEARRAFGQDTRGLAQYMGQHTSLDNPPNPISFSRFSEQTAEIPGLGKREGIYVNELQSDLLDDIRKFGSKGGSKEKDEKLMASLETGMDDLVARIRQAEAAGDPAAVEQLRNQHKTMKSQLFYVNSRLSRAESGEGVYDLPEAFAGMESSPQVIQQLMAKNAIMGAIQQGKSFVAFPGAESAQAQLYEKLPRNLKSVVKDLGPGFELRDVMLTTPDGKQIMHPSIVWGPEAAARIQKKGVPFKDGGMVERRTDESRKYL